MCGKLKVGDPRASERASEFLSKERSSFIVPANEKGEDRALRLNSVVSKGPFPIVVWNFVTHTQRIYPRPPTEVALSGGGWKERKVGGDNSRDLM